MTVALLTDSSLTKKETLRALLKYIIEDPAPTATESQKFRYVRTQPRLTCRYPVVACEILTAEVDEIERELVNDTELLSLLFGFFAKEEVNVLLANLVVRLMVSLMNTRLPAVCSTNLEI